MTKWQKKLTKAERRHCAETKGTTLTNVKSNVLFQQHLKFPCWVCVSIGRKLGMDVKLTAFHNGGR